MAVKVNHVIIHKTGTWYVVNTSPPSGTPTTYTVMEGTENDALNLPNGGGISGPYNTLAQADKIAGGEPPNATVEPIPGLKISPSGGVSGPVGSPLGGLASIGQFFDRLSEASTWIRVGEVLLGLALVIVGAAKLFSNTPVGRAAEKAGKVAMLI